MSLWPPENTEDAIMRLPNREHPLYNTDATIEHLAHYADWLDEAILLAPILDLEETC